MRLPLASGIGPGRQTSLRVRGFRLYTRRLDGYRAGHYARENSVGGLHPSTSCSTRDGDRSQARQLWGFERRLRGGCACCTRPARPPAALRRRATTRAREAEGSSSIAGRREWGKCANRERERDKQAQAPPSDAPGYLIGASTGHSGPTASLRGSLGRIRDGHAPCRFHGQNER